MTNTSKGTDADGKPISFTIVYDSSKRNQVGDSIVERPPRWYHYHCCSTSLLAQHQALMPRLT